MSIFSQLLYFDDSEHISLSYVITEIRTFLTLLLKETFDMNAGALFQSPLQTSDAERYFPAPNHKTRIGRTSIFRGV